MAGAKPKVIHQWRKPKKVSICEMNEVFRQGRIAAPRILVFVAGLLLVLHYFLRSVLPEDMGVSFAKAFIVVFVFAVALVCCFYLACPLIDRYSRPTYKITDKGIDATGGGKSWHLLWNRMEGYLLSKHEQLPEITVLWIHARGIGGRLYLPEDELAQRIVSSVAEKIPQMQDIPNSLKRIELSKGQYTYLAFFTVAYSMLGAYCLVLNKNKNIGPVVCAVTMVLGPGTLGLLALYGKRFLRNRYLRAYAMVVNLTAVALIMLSTMLFFFYHFSKQIGQT